MKKTLRTFEYAEPASASKWVLQKVLGSVTGDVRRLRRRHLAMVVLLSLVFCSVANHCLAYWLGLPRSTPWARSMGNYRRIGPIEGPQVFCAGSSLLVSGLSWPAVSQSLGQGIEDWTVAGSSPEIWEVLQPSRKKAYTTIIGISVYDLNEMRPTADRATYVPLAETISDLLASTANPSVSRRILMQYAMKYVRVLFPAAGQRDKVLTGLRAKAAEALGLNAALEAHEGEVMERDGILDAGEVTMRLSDWSSARVLRRLAVLREENYGVHEFLHGPKNRALERILSRARQHGPVIVVVLPVSRSYMQEFLDKRALDEFEKAVNDDMKIAPEAKFVRLDRVPGITDDKYFTDLVHLNVYGRRLTTPIFLEDIAEAAGRRECQRAWTGAANPDGQ